MCCSLKCWYSEERLSLRTTLQVLCWLWWININKTVIIIIFSSYCCFLKLKHIYRNMTSVDISWHTWSHNSICPRTYAITLCVIYYGHGIIDQSKKYLYCTGQSVNTVKERICTAYWMMENTMRSHAQFNTHIVRARPVNITYSVF